MAKKVVSVSLRKKNPTKHGNKRRKLRTVLRKIFNYMKSDTYMFAPLVFAQSHLTPSPASFGGVSCEPFKEKQEKKFVEGVEEYLKCDCYMYAPLAMDSVSDSASPLIGDVDRGKVDIRDVCREMEPRMEETVIHDENTLSSIIREDEDDGDAFNPDIRRVVVKHNLVQKEKVKRVVHQNCRSSSVPGKELSQKTTSKIVVE